MVHMILVVTIKKRLKRSFSTVIRLEKPSLHPRRKAEARSDGKGSTSALIVKEVPVATTT